PGPQGVAPGPAPVGAPGGGGRDSPSRPAPKRPTATPAGVYETSRLKRGLATLTPTPSATIRTRARCIVACVENGGTSSMDGARTTASALLTVGFARMGPGPHRDRQPCSDQIRKGWSFSTSSRGARRRASPGHVLVPRARTPRARPAHDPAYFFGGLTVMVRSRKFDWPVLSDQMARTV